jgi:hypothetical protein
VTQVAVQAVRRPQLDLEDLQTFIEVADAAGVSAAARRLRVSKSIVSRFLLASISRPSNSATQDTEIVTEGDARGGRESRKRMLLRETICTVAVEL